MVCISEVSVDRTEVVDTTGEDVSDTVDSGGGGTVDTTGVEGVDVASIKEFVLEITDNEVSHK